MDNNKPIRMFRCQLAIFYFLRCFVFCLILLAFGGGTVVLAIRVLLCRSLSSGTAVIASAVALFLIILFALARSFLQIPSFNVLVAVFDKMNHCGGLLMASSETNIGLWGESLLLVKPPKIKWEMGYWPSVCVLSLCFLVFSFLVPQRYITANPEGKLEIGDQVKQIQEQIQVLEEENILATEKTEELSQKLKQIKENSSGREPVKTWESLSHLQDQLKKAAEKASVGMLDESENLSKVEALAKALSQAEGQMNQEAMAEAMSELSQLTDGLIKRNAAMSDCLSENLLSCADSGQLSPEQLQELIDSLRNRKDELSNSMGRLYEIKLSDLQMMQMCENSGQSCCDCNSLSAMLLGCSVTGECKNSIELFMNNPNWGVGRGRGDAPMTWSDMSNEEGVVFKEQVLPAASVNSLKDAQLVGVSVSAPSVEEGHENLQSGTLNNADAGSASAVRQTILPKHRRVVEGYFYHNN